MAVLTTRSRRTYLAAEFGCVFFGAVLLYGAVDASPIPVLLVLCAAAVVYLLRRPGFDRSTLWRLDTGRLPPILLLWGVAAAASALAVALLVPGALFRLPDDQQWALLLVIYPLLSVYPQELVFRAFLFERYAPVFGTGVPMVAASAVAFGFVHVVYGHWLPVALSAIGGWIFAERYRRTRSVVAVSVEHALYGLLMFALGLGRFFLS